MFAVHFMLCYIIYLYGTECSQTDMQCNISNIYAFILYSLHKLFCKVKSCCGSGCRTQFVTVNCLVTLFVFKFLRNIRRKRHLTDFVKCAEKVFVTFKVNYSVAVIFYFCNGSF
jgi:hypothetical protein